MKIIEQIKFFKITVIWLICYNLDMVLGNSTGQATSLQSLVAGSEILDHMLSNDDPQIADWFHKDSINHGNIDERIDDHKQAVDQFLQELLTDQKPDPIDYFTSMLILQDSADHASKKLKQAKFNVWKMKHQPLVQRVENKVSKKIEDEQAEIMQKLENEKEMLTEVHGGNLGVKNLSKLYAVFNRN